MQPFVEGALVTTEVWIRNRLPSSAPRAYKLQFKLACNESKACELDIIRTWKM